MEWLAGVDLEKVANAIVILVTGLAVGLGFRQGMKAPSLGPAAGSVEIAGALVDSSSIKQAAIELSGMTGALGRQNELMERHMHLTEQMTLAIDRHRHAVDDHTEQVRELRQAMQARR